MDLSAYRSESYGDIFSLLTKMESAEDDAAEPEKTKRSSGLLGKLGIGKKKANPSPTFFAPPLFAALADEEAALQALPPFDFDALEGDGAFFGGQDERTLASSVRLGSVDVNDLMWGDEAPRPSSADPAAEDIVAEDASTDDTLNSYLASQNERTLASSVRLGSVDVNDLMWGDEESRPSSADPSAEDIVAEDASTDDTHVGHMQRFGPSPSDVATANDTGYLAAEDITGTTTGGQYMRLDVARASVRDLNRKTTDAPGDLSGDLADELPAYDVAMLAEEDESMAELENDVLDFDPSSEPPPDDVDAPYLSIEQSVSAVAELTGDDSFVSALADEHRKEDATRYASVEATRDAITDLAPGHTQLQPRLPPRNSMRTSAAAAAAAGDDTLAEGHDETANRFKGGSPELDVARSASKRPKRSPKGRLSTRVKGIFVSTRKKPAPKLLKEQDAFVGPTPSPSP
jgi:hypothetical protein